MNCRSSRLRKSGATSSALRVPGAAHSWQLSLIAVGLSTASDGEPVEGDTEQPAQAARQPESFVQLHLALKTHADSLGYSPSCSLSIRAFLYYKRLTPMRMATPIGVLAMLKIVLTVLCHSGASRNPDKLWYWTPVSAGVTAYSAFPWITN
jgi:hypothetical protein